MKGKVWLMCEWGFDEGGVAGAGECGRRFYVVVGKQSGVGGEYAETDDDWR